MPERAHVSSIEAIEAFRSSLITYLSRARPVVEEACGEAHRTRQWIEHDRRMHWENELRRRSRKLEEAEQELFSARLSNLREPTSAQQMAVQRAKRAVTEAEEKLRLIKRWTGEIEHRVAPLLKQLEHLGNLLATEMPKAAAHLAQLIKTLDAYAGVSPSPASAAPASSGGTPAPPAESGSDGAGAGGGP